MTRLRVPGSSANLGPGFDALGLALNLHLEVRFRPAGSLLIHAAGCDAEQIPCDATNLIWRTAVDVAARLNRTLPFAELAIHNAIPLGKGLGSSAAAIVAGVVLADSLLNLAWPRSEILNEAARREGHPDNAAASVLGGIVASAIDRQGRTSAIRLELPAECQLALILPDEDLPTHKSRSALPDSYPRLDLVFNVQRAALLVAALATGKLDALEIALEDRAHQPYRSALVPNLDRILACRAPGLLGSVLSGAGPAVLVFFRRGFDVEHAFSHCLHNARWAPVSVARDGYEIVAL